MPYHVPRCNPGLARIVRTHPVDYLGQSRGYLELHIPGEKGPSERIPVHAHDRAALDAARARLLTVAHERGYRVRQNPALQDAFVDKNGLIHPIARSKGYSQALEDARARRRKETGLTAADQQEQERFDRELDRAERTHGERIRVSKLPEKLATLETEADYLKAKLADEPANEFVELVSDRGRARAESGLIPFETARRYLPKRPESYTSALVTRQGHKYLRWEYVLDELASNLGYPSDEAFRHAIEQSREDRKKLEALKREIRDVKTELRQAESHRAKRNPSAGPSWLERLWAWLTR